ncbi:flagellar hook-basal body protein [Sphingomonas elodea]|uniref:flagellar hook-basal body protein n=1 Tax=Sphingomonas elodea TaxID=179878 RepID=UPI0002631389|nr:flagellar hook basal-body protein [Sphingomonas elodea]
MSGLVEAATAILGASEKRLEIAAHNVANISTPGFKRQIGFADLLQSSGERDPALAIGIHRNFAQGKLSETRNPFDLAISGAGFFQLRAGDRILYSRQGQFSLSAEGRLVTPQGYVLQQQGGGDLVLDRAGATITQDGTVLDDGRPIARIELFSASDANALSPVGESCFSAGAARMEPIADPVIRQGMVESSNVELGDEMVSMMTALRQSESGAKLMQTYDDLIGRVMSSLGQTR